MKKESRTVSAISDMNSSPISIILMGYLATERERLCDDIVKKGTGPQFGDWMRATPAKKRDQRSRWSGGSNACQTRDSGTAHRHRMF